MKNAALICLETLEAWLLAEGSTLLGRDPACDLQVFRVEASRRHCLVMNEGGLVTVSDLGSANGTEVNGWRIHGTLELTSGDVLRVGGLTFVFRQTEASSAPSDARGRQATRIASANSKPVHCRGGVHRVA